MVEAARALADLESVFNALAHPARRQILLTIHYWGGAMTAGDVARRFGHSWPTTTRHLQSLEDAGFLQHERVGRLRRYTLNRERLSVVRDWLKHFDAATPSRSAASTSRPRSRTA
jgi:DNA-binding transcriptional ArsR family regulator